MATDDRSLLIRSIRCSIYAYTIFLKCMQGIDTYTPRLLSINMRGIQMYLLSVILVLKCVFSYLI